MEIDLNHNLNGFRLTYASAFEHSKTNEDTDKRYQ